MWSGNPPGGSKLAWKPPGGPEVFEGPSRKSVSGRGTLPEVQNWFGILPEVRKFLVDNPGSP